MNCLQGEEVRLPGLSQTRGRDINEGLFGDRPGEFAWHKSVNSWSPWFIYTRCKNAGAVTGQVLFECCNC